MIIDSHCHLSYKDNTENIDNVIRNANDVDVKKLLNIATNSDDFKDVINVSSKYENIYYTLGIHPHEAKETTNAVIDEIKKHINDPKMLAIGETGLDFYYNHAEKKTQIRSQISEEIWFSEYVLNGHFMQDYFFFKIFCI